MNPSCLNDVENAMIVDVRTPAEYNNGHVRGSINVPLNTIQERASELERSEKPIVLCCASGMRSGNATQYLKARGIECCNGGSWMTVDQALRQIR